MFIPYFMICAGADAEKLTIMREVLGIGAQQPVTTPITKTVFQSLHAIHSHLSMSGKIGKGLKTFFSHSNNHSSPAGDAEDDTAADAMPPPPPASASCTDGASPRIAWFENSSALFKRSNDASTATGKLMSAKQRRAVEMCWHMVGGPGLLWCVAAESRSFGNARARKVCCSCNSFPTPML